MCPPPRGLRNRCAKSYKTSWPSSVIEEEKHHWIAFARASQDVSDDEIRAKEDAVTRFPLRLATPCFSRACNISAPFSATNPQAALRRPALLLHPRWQCPPASRASGLFLHFLFPVTLTPVEQDAKMNKLFCPLLEKLCPLFKHLAQLRSKISPTVVHFAHFHVQARKRGVLRWTWGYFVYVHIPERGV